MDNKKDMQEKLVDEKIRGINIHIDSNYTILNNKIDSNQILLMEKLEQILKQATKTNGRVTTLEKETRFVRTISRYPKLAALAFVGVIGSALLLGVQTLFKIF